MAKSSSKTPLILIVCIIGGVFLLCCGGGVAVTMLYTKERSQVQAELKSADAKWAAGDKKAAAEEYRGLLKSYKAAMKAEEKETVYGRLVDVEFENNNEAEAKKLLLEAEFERLEPKVSHARARELIAATAAENARAKAESAKKPTPASKPKENPPTALDQLKAAKGDDLVPVQLLHGEYNSNEVAADAKYKGKTINVIGEVGSVEQGGLITAVRIHFNSNVGTILVIAHLTGAAGKSPELLQVKSGSLVRVQGRCTGKNLIGSVELSGCIFAINEK